MRINTHKNDSIKEKKAVLETSEASEILYWCELLNCTEDELRSSIRSVSSSKEIGNYFKKAI